MPFRNWAYAGCSVCALGAVVTSVRVAPGLLGVLGAGLAILMIAIALADARYFIIPDLLVLAALGLGLLQALLVQPGNFLAAMASSVLRGLALGLAFWSLRKAYKWLRGREVAQRIDGISSAGKQVLIVWSLSIAKGWDGRTTRSSRHEHSPEVGLPHRLSQPGIAGDKPCSQQLSELH